MRFITFGCSHTFGEGISEEDVSDRTTPSRYSWPSLIQQKYKIPVINYSRPGASNHFILNSVREHKWQKNDIALVLFTYPIRYSYYKEEEKTCENIIPNISRSKGEEQKICKSFYKNFSNYHVEKVNLIDVEHVYLFLKYYKIPYLTRFSKNFTLVTDELNQEIKQDLQVNFTNFSSQFLENERYGYDGMHFSKKVHEEWTNHISSYINSIIDFLLHRNSNL